MLKMPQINHIRDLHKSGYSIEEIHRQTGADHKTIRKYLAMEDFSPKAPTSKQRQSIVTPYVETIAGWLREDQNHWKKQWHTAKRIYDRLVAEHGFTGSYDSVQKFVKRIRDNIRTEATQELVWDPGTAQADFGEADFYENGECVRRKYLAVSFPYSNDGFCQVFMGETAECVCQGLVDIFRYIGGVPRLLVFDNATGVGRRVMDQVHETELFSRFRAHHGFRVRFCNPYAGYEKGHVENKAGTIRRNTFVPAPRYHDIEEYNRTLLDEHKRKAGEKHYKKGVAIAELFSEDVKHLLPLPRVEFNVCTYRTVRADGYGKVCLDGRHHYSTRPENSRKEVVVGVRAHYVDILGPDGSLLVRHKRQYGPTRTDTTDASTTLDMLAKNIGAWENSSFRRDAPADIRDYIDSQQKKDRRETVKLLAGLVCEFGYPSALRALETAIDNGNVNKSDAAVLVARISGYGIDTPPSPGPSLEVYDREFLPPAAEGRERSAS